MASSSKSKGTSSELLPKKLSQLHPDINNALVIALVLNKTEPNIFMGKNDTQYRGVINFTVRDSKKDIVNCKFWGLREKTEEYYKKFELGDIIDIIYPKIAMVTQYGDSKQPRYHPLTTLPITLILNEGKSFLEKHSSQDVENYDQLKNLWRTSHKPLFSVLNLKDVKMSVNTMKKQTYFSDFLVMVGLVKPVREVKTTRDNKVRHCVELVVFDQSLPDGMLFTMWNADWIKRANELWPPMQTVLHLIDVKVSYSDFYKGCILNLTSRGFIYENPFGEETQKLMKFAAAMPPNTFEALMASGSSNMPKPDDIQTVMTVQQIYARAEGPLSDDTDHFTAVLYAMITKFDLDGLNSVISKKCKLCQRFIAKHKTVCESEKCALSAPFNHDENEFEYFLNINLHLSDHTGTLLEGRLSDATAERILGVSCLEFQQLNDEQLEQLKWRFLMEYFQVKLFVKKATATRKNLMIIVVDMRFTELDELSKNISVF